MNPPAALLAASTTGAALLELGGVLVVLAVLGRTARALSLPTIVGRAGAEEIIAIRLDDAEQGAFRRSAEALKQWLAAVR